MIRARQAGRRPLLLRVFPTYGGALLLLALAACQQNGFVRVTVQETDAGSPLPTVYQIRSTATDNTLNGTPSVVLGPQVPAGITFPKTFVVAVPSSATSLTELVEGLDLFGNAVLRGSNSATFARGAQTPLQISLSQACNSSLDCDPEAFCQGQLDCTPQGACVATPSTAPPGFGVPCGDDGGRCDADLVCVEPFGTCGDGVQGSDPLPDGGIFDEPCDWGNGDDGGICTGPDGACNSDQPDACRPDCTLPSCGDGVVDTGEKCDLGAANGTQHGCNATCTLLGKAFRIAGNGDVSDAGAHCVAGCYVDGPGSQAQFEEVSGIAVVGHTLYVADNLNELIRAVDLGSAPAYNVSTLAGDAGPTAGGGGACATTQDGTGNAACFFLPFQPMAYQGTLLVGTGSAIRQITLPGGVVSTFAGPNSGNSRGPNASFPVPLAQARFNNVTGLAVDSATGLIYTVDQSGGYLYVINPDAGTMDLIAGANNLASFAGPTSVVVVSGALFVTDTGSYNIDRVSLPSADAGASVTKVAGNGGPGFADSSATAPATFNGPAGLCTDGRTIYVADQTNRAIRQLDPVTYAVTTVLGGPDAGIFHNPYGCAWDPDAGILYVSDQSTPPATPDGIGNVIYMVQ